MPLWPGMRILLRNSRHRILLSGVWQQISSYMKKRDPPKGA